jgi:hypothetical protein
MRAALGYLEAFPGCTTVVSKSRNEVDGGKKERKKREEGKCSVTREVVA